MKACFCDLDGPLLEVSEKYYRAYADIIVEQGGQPIVKECYWELKRQRTPATELLRLSAVPLLPVNLFIGNWAARVESRDYLLFDRLQPGAADTVDLLAERYALVLVTLRRSRELLLWQLAEVGLLSKLAAVLSSGEERTPRWRVKYDLVAAHYRGEPPDCCWFIGDTETDMEAGRHLGARTIAVTNGIRSPAILLQSSPDFLIPTIDKIASTSILS